jgi:hypothetical protein
VGDTEIECERVRWVERIEPGKQDRNHSDSMLLRFQLNEPSCNDPRNVERKVACIMARNKKKAKNLQKTREREKEKE